MKRRHPSNDRTNRGGFITVAVMACVLIVSMMAVALVRTGVSQRRQVRQYDNQLQAEALADSGMDRALVQLDRNAGYTGETWSIAAGQLPAGAAGRVLIEVTQSDMERTIRVTADYPEAGRRRVRASRTVRRPVSDETRED